MAVHWFSIRLAFWTLAECLSHPNYKGKIYLLTLSFINHVKSNIISLIRTYGVSLSEKSVNDLCKHEQNRFGKSFSRMLPVCQMRTLGYYSDKM